MSRRACPWCGKQIPVKGTCDCQTNPPLPATFRNWFVAPVVTEFVLTVGTKLRTGHDVNETAGDYRIADLQQIDADTVHIVMKRLKP